jgi:hypothetical protein
MIVVVMYDFLFNLSIQFEYRAPDSIPHLAPSATGAKHNKAARRYPDGLSMRFDCETDYSFSAAKISTR